MEKGMLRAINHWNKIKIDLLADKIKVDKNGKYPARWEPIIQEAVEAKRNGDFLFAIELYLSLIDVEKNNTSRSFIFSLQTNPLYWKIRFCLSGHYACRTLCKDGMGASVYTKYVRGADASDGYAMGARNKKKRT